MDDFLQMKFFIGLFVNENQFIVTEISMKVVSNGPIGNKLAWG